MKVRAVVVAVVAAVGLSACATGGGLQGPVYGSQEQRQLSRSLLYGEVLEVKPVILQGKQANVRGVGTGAVAGGALGVLAGGALGSKVGGGTGKKLATAAGAVVGGAVGASVGNQVGERAAQRQGVEVVVRLQSGRIISALQEANPHESFSVGAVVRATEYRGGWHVSPL